MQLNTNYTMFSVKYKGPVHVIKSLIAEGGLSSLYKGYFYFSQEPFKAHWLPVVIMLRVITPFFSLTEEYYAKSHVDFVYERKSSFA